MDHERRRHPRVELKAFGFRQACDLKHPTRDVKVMARIIDLSRGGARVRIEPPADKAAFVKGERFTLHSELSLRGFSLDGCTCAVRWSNWPEVGLQFEPELTVGIAELQIMLTR